jgi:hypothetical protein
MSHSETLHEHLAKHPLTRQLKDLGVTDEELEAIRFFGNRAGRPFSQWAFTWKKATPDALPLMNAYCALKWLILEDPPEPRDRQDAWLLVSRAMGSPEMEIAWKYRAEQKRKASRPRVRLTEGGETIHNLIERLALSDNYRSLSSKELWPHFFSELSTLGLDPEETSQAVIYYYSPNGSKRHITQRHFANLVARYRKREKRSE